MCQRRLAAGTCTASSASKTSRLFAGGWSHLSRCRWNNWLNSESLNASTNSTYAHFAPPLCRTGWAVPGAAPSAPQFSGPWLTSAEGGDWSLCCIAATGFVRLRDETVTERLGKAAPSHPVLQRQPSSHLHTGCWSHRSTFSAPGPAGSSLRNKTEMWLEFFKRADKYSA